MIKIKVYWVSQIIIMKRETSWDYWIATEYNGDVPGGFSSLEIPASKMGGIGGSRSNTRGYREYVETEWFPSHRCEHAEIASLEEYMGASPNPSCKIWVPIK